MGVRSVIGNPAEVIWEAINAPGETIRRHLSRRRMRFYRDDTAEVFRAELQRIVNDAERRKRIAQFAWMGSALSFYKRVINEIAGPPYAIAPTRRIDGNGQAPFDLVARECRYDRRAAYACKVAHAGNTAFTMFRYVPRLGVVKDVITADAVTVIPDPDDPTRMLGFAYDKPVMVGGRREMHRVFWDDEEAFELNERGTIVPIQDNTGARSFRLTKDNGHPGILPVVDIHVYERSGEFWDMTTGSDLEAAQGALQFISTSALRLIHTQGHTQVGVSGDPGNFPRGQTLDQENPIFAGDGNTLTPIVNQTSTSGHMAMADHIALATGANYGVNRDRMNQKITGEQDMVGLLERRQEAITIFAEVERREFDVVSVVSRQHKDPTKRIPEGATMTGCDFAELSHKVDRMALLGIWREEIKLNLRNELDCIREDNPEIRSEEDAFEEIRRNAKIRARVVELMRELNISGEANQDEPGQSPEANGAMGSAVRDGEMTKDEAAAQAIKGRAAK